MRHARQHSADLAPSLRRRDAQPSTNSQTQGSASNQVSTSRALVPLERSRSRPSLRDYRPETAFATQLLATIFPNQEERGNLIQAVYGEEEDSTRDQQQGILLRSHI